MPLAVPATSPLWVRLLSALRRHIIFAKSGYRSAPPSTAFIRKVLIMRTLLAALCLATVLFVPLVATAEPLPATAPDSVGLSSAALAQVDALVQSYVSSGKLAGALMLVARDGKVAHAGVF